MARAARRHRRQNDSRASHVIDPTHHRGCETRRRPGFAGPGLPEAPLDRVVVTFVHDFRLSRPSPSSPASRCRAENNLDLTVFSGTSIASLISWYDSSAKYLSDDHLAIVLAERRQRGLDPVVQLGRLHRVGQVPRGPHRGAQRLARPPGALEVQALVDRDPVEPAEEPPGRIVRVEPFVGPDERVLRRIPRVLVVAQHPQGHAEEDSLVTRDDGLERRGIAPEATANPCRRRRSAQS